jgi:GGDEF domain-containing protein
MSSVELTQLGIEWTRYGSLFDQATGLPSGWGFLFDRLEVALARTRRTGTLVALFILDEPRLSIEHRFEDVVSSLRAQLRAGDTIARIGEHRLVIVCTDILRDEEAAQLARQVLADAGVICTLGVVLGGPDDESDQLLARGIAALTPRINSDDR